MIFFLLFCRLKKIVCFFVEAPVDRTLNFFLTSASKQPQIQDEAKKEQADKKSITKFCEQRFAHVQQQQQ